MACWKQDKKWKFQFKFLGKRHGGGGYKTRGDALQAQEDLKREIKSTRPIQEGTDLLTAISLYLDEAERRFVKKTYEYKRFVLKKFKDFVGNLPLKDIGECHIHTYLKTRASNINFNRHRKEISAFFNFIIKKRLGISYNPCVLLEKLPESPIRKTDPTEEEVKKVLESASTEVRFLLLIIIHTLARIGEILKLEWKDVDFDRGTITLYTRKRKGGSLESDDLIMNDVLRAVLIKLYENRIQDRWVVFNKKTRSRYTRRPKLMNGLCQKAKVRPFGFHRLRHFSASWLADQGESLKTMQGLLRQKNLRTTEIYLHHIESSEKRAIKRLEGLIPVVTTSSDLKEKAV